MEPMTGVLMGVQRRYPTHELEPREHQYDPRPSVAHGIPSLCRHRLK
jgi:hypothetical protein